jgi:hypothetical protein
MLYEYLLLGQTPLAEKMSFEEIMEKYCNAKKVPSTVLVANGPGAHSASKLIPELTVQLKMGKQVVFIIGKHSARVLSGEDQINRWSSTQRFASARVRN